MKLRIIDWSDDAYIRTYKRTGKASRECIAEIEIESFKGFCYYDGRLDISGHPETIWVWSSQFSIEVCDD